MKTILSISIFLIQFTAHSQIEWKKTSNWRLYSIGGNNLFRYSLDTLNKLNNCPLNIDSIQYYLKYVEVIHPNGLLAWMGGYVVTYQFEHQIRKIDISNYGGFFYEEQTKSYYQLPKDKVLPWLSYFGDQFYDLVTQKQQ